MMPPAAARALPELTLPAPAPVPLLAGTVAPSASKSLHHIAGRVRAQVEYADLNAFSWYLAGGRVLRGAGRMHRRGLSGLEDGAHNERR